MDAPEQNPILIEGADVVTPDAVCPSGWVLTSGSRIDAIGTGAPPPAPPGTERIDATGLVAFPGFIDAHVHGGGGADTMDADPEALRTMARFHATHGVTTMVPTTWSASEGDIAAAIAAIDAVRGPVEGGATILGAHLEGPWISPDRAGAQDPAHIRDADLDEVRRLTPRIVKIVTIAPERPGASELITDLTGRRIIVSMGHSDATYEQAVAAVRLGIRHVTHTYNAMAPLENRSPGVLGCALTRPQLRCELIADSIHVHRGAIDVLARAKGRDGILLVSDAIRAAGLPDGPVDLGGRTGSCCGGAVRLADGTLAGSVLTLDVALANFRAATGWPWPDLAMAVSGNVAAHMRLPTKGRLVAGADADLVLVDADGAVRFTVILGQVVYRAPATS